MACLQIIIIYYIYIYIYNIIYILLYITNLISTIIHGDKEKEKTHQNSEITIYQIIAWGKKKKIIGRKKKKKRKGQLRHTS